MVFFSLLPYTTIFDAIATPPRRDRKAHSGRATSRKGAFCAWASPKGALCVQAVTQNAVLREVQRKARSQNAPFREVQRAECAFP